MKNKSRYALTGLLILYGALTAASTLFGEWSTAGLLMMLAGGLLLLWAAFKLLPQTHPRFGPALVVGGAVLAEAGAVTNELLVSGALSIVSQALRIGLSILLIVWYLRETKKQKD